jgi:hypothetical protein
MRWLSIFAASGRAPSLKSMSHSASSSPTLLEDQKIVHAALVRNVIARMTARRDYKASIRQCRRSGVVGAKPSPLPCEMTARGNLSPTNEQFDVPMISLLVTFVTCWGELHGYQTPNRSGKVSARSVGRHIEQLHAGSQC